MRHVMALRVSKAVLVLAVALFYTILVLNNITDYGSNYEFVRHVLMMDSTFPGNHGMWRAVNSPSSRTDADDRLSPDPFGPVEGGDGIVEGSHFADVCPQPTIPDPLDDLTQLGAIGYDDEVNSQAASGPRLGRAGDGHQRSSDANHARRPLRDIAAEDIENQIDPADIFQGVVIEVDELLCAEVERRLTAGSAPGADDVRAGPPCELARHRTDYAGRTVHEDALPRAKAAVLEQPRPRGQARHH